ncbi:MAG: flagellar biosynthetic protein FliO [Pseudomonadota bacterium]|nr:flagellar biosynthetic protein FliO [Pseudomonadota bacterium]
MSAGATVAADSAPMLTTDPMASAGKVAMFLVLILGLIVGLAWLANRVRMIQPSSRQGALSLVSVLSVGQKEKIAIVQAGEQQIVVGITAHSISTLATLDEPIEQDTVTRPDFASVLAKAVKK